MLVEAVFVLPVLVILLFGMIDMGSVYNDYISLRQGTREGARQAAITGILPPLPPSGTWASNGCPTTGIATTGDGYDIVCFTKSRIGLDQSKTRVSLYFTPQVSPAAPYAVGQGVVICTQYKSGSITGVLSPILSNTVLTSQVEIRIEQDDLNLLAPVQETPFQAWATSCSTP